MVPFVFCFFGGEVVEGFLLVVKGYVIVVEAAG